MKALRPNLLAELYDAGLTVGRGLVLLGERAFNGLEAG